MLFLVGDLTQWHLPVGMKDLNLSDLINATGALPASEKAKVKDYKGP